jgi:hypothetical protein
MTKRFFLKPGKAHVFCEHPSPVDESAFNSKPKSFRQVGRNLFNVRHKDLANYRQPLAYLIPARRRRQWWTPS